ncbi:MAG: tetratricopeptide repeat protein [Myxococcota bacterium]
MKLPPKIAERARAGDAEGALGALEPLRDRMGTDRDVALAWMELVAAVPSRDTLVDEAREALEAFRDDPQVVVAACAALIARAQLRAPDEPALEEGPARIAADAAARCLERLGEASEADRELHGYLWINRANALRHLGGAFDDEAQEAYRRALELEPERARWWFDLGVLHKWRGRYDAGFDAFLKARARLGDDKPLLWNLAICATALGRGDVAAGIWAQLGMPATVNERSGMPSVQGLPPVQVRVPTRGPGTGADTDVPDRAVGFELLWVAPLSPCHGVVQTPPFREAPVDYGDVVLWDGAPLGVAEDGTPRFALLTRLRAGDEHRFRFVGLQQGPGDVERLAPALPDGVRVFIHRERVEHVCPRCASGDALRKHQHEPAEAHRIVYGTMVAPAATDLGAFRSGLEGALRSGGRVALALPGLYEAIGDTKAAGQQHQAWRGIERTAVKRGLAGGPASA